MNNVQLNIENLVSLWQTVSEPLNSFFTETDFNYSLIKDSEWPNRIWFNKAINDDVIYLVKEKLASTKTKITVPYWNIYENDATALFEKNEFDLKFEQIGMSLKTMQLLTDFGNLQLTKVTSREGAKLWSVLFKKAFGYFIHPNLINTTQKHTEFYIAHHQNEMVGTAIIHTTNNISGIHSLGIIPAQRRKGYAEEIMKLLIN